MALLKNYEAFRHAPWGGNTNEVYLDIGGEDWSGANFSWIFANAPGGTALISLGIAGAGLQGISRTYDPTAIHPKSGQVVGATRMLPQIDEATLEGLADDPGGPSADISLYHTLYATPLGKSKRVLLFGTLTVKQGAPN